PFVWTCQPGISEVEFPINFLHAVFDSNEGKKELPAIGNKVSQETQQKIKQTVQAILVKMAPVITRCGHAGIINILTFSREQFPNEPVEAVVGGLHLFPATDDQLNWTADQMKDFKVAAGAHCTGIEAVYRIRERLGLPWSSAVVGNAGSSFVLGDIHPGRLAKGQLRYEFQTLLFTCHPAV